MSHDFQLGINRMRIFKKWNRNPKWKISINDLTTENFKLKWYITSKNKLSSMKGTRQYFFCLINFLLEIQHKRDRNMTNNPFFELLKRKIIRNCIILMRYKAFDSGLSKIYILRSKMRYSCKWRERKEIKKKWMNEWIDK